MPKLSVGIICGGRSLEHEVSLNSALQVVQFIDKARFKATILWIDKKGGWHYVENISSNVFSNKIHGRNVSILLQNSSSQFILHSFNGNNDIINNLLHFDIFFPMTHGILGEDGSLQGLLRIMNVPFVGSGVLGSAIGMDKDISKRLLRDSGLLVTPFKTFFDYEKKNINFHDIVATFGLPFFIKPVNQGSSIGVSKVFNLQNFNQALLIAFSLSQKVLIEPAVIGRELGCAVLGNSNPKVSVCGEIIVKKDNFYSYECKRVQNNLHIIIPAAIDNVTKKKIRSIALKAFKALNCFGMARIDFFLTIDNQIFVNEINTLPGFTKNSIYPKLWLASGINIQELITELIELALDFHKNNFVSN